MRNRILIFILCCLLCVEIMAQRTAHPEFLLKYYFTANEPIKQSVVPKPEISDHVTLRNFGFQCFPNKSFAIDDTKNAIPYLEFQTTPQLGFDTILPIEERIACGPFMSSRTEITNQQYKEFLADVQWIHASGYTISQLYPDTTVWKDIAATAERSSVQNPFRNYYFQSENFPNFPVVGISQLKAKAYCAWLQYKMENNPSKSQQQWIAALKKDSLRFEIDLPTAAEWEFLYKKAIEMPFEKKSLSVSKGNRNHSMRNFSGILFSKSNVGNALLDFIFNKTSNAEPVVYKGITTNRGYQISEISNLHLSRPEPVSNIDPKNPNQLSHLLGNVAEWTSTPAYGHLYNSNTTILNTTGNLIPNPHQQVNVFDLTGYLVDELALQSHFVVKGGSWAQEFHYLDPSAVQMMQSNHATNFVGFRPVIRFYKK